MTFPDKPDSERDPDEIAEALMQTAWLLWKRSLDVSAKDFNGTMTVDEMERAQKQLAIFADAHAHSYPNYREGLIRAGFKEINKTIEKGEDYVTYELSLTDFVELFKQKQVSVSPMPKSE